MTLPPIDLTGIMKMLRQEGTSELYAVGTGKVNQTFKIVQEWETILRELDKTVIILKQGGDIKHLYAPTKAMAKSAGKLGAMATQVLSFVPGPIGIVCSVINAILCFCEGNVIGGMLELLGCIPGGKAATKGAAKLAPKMEMLLIELVGKCPELAKIMKQAEKTQKAINRFLQKVSKQNGDIARQIEKSSPSAPKPSLSTPQSIMNKTAGADKQIKSGELTVGRTMQNGQLKQYRDLNYGTQNYYLNNSLFHF